MKITKTIRLEQDDIEQMILNFLNYNGYSALSEFKWNFEYFKDDIIVLDGLSVEVEDYEP